MVPYDMTFEPPKGRIMTGIDIGIEMFFISEMVTIFAISPLVLRVRMLLAHSLDRNRDCQSEIAERDRARLHMYVVTDFYALLSTQCINFFTSYFDDTGQEVL